MESGQITSKIPGAVHFWTGEADPTAKRQFLSLNFEGVWPDQDRVVAVQPKPSFLPFFEKRREEAAGRAGVKVRERRGSNPRLSPRRSRSGYRRPHERTTGAQEPVRSTQRPGRQRPLGATASSPQPTATGQSRSNAALIAAVRAGS